MSRASQREGGPKVSSLYRAGFLAFLLLVSCFEAIPQQVAAPPPKTVDDGKTEEVQSPTWVDANHGLMWQTHEDTPRVDFDGPRLYCAGLHLNGLTGWRLPTITELRTLYSPSFQSDLQAEPYSHVRDEIKLTYSVVWSGDPGESGRLSFYYFDFQSGASKWTSYPARYPYKTPKTLCVRSATQSEIAEQKKQDVRVNLLREYELRIREGPTERARPDCRFRSYPPAESALIDRIAHEEQEILDNVGKTIEKGSDTSWTEHTCYSGPNSEWVQKLLLRAGPWNCPWHAHEPDGSPPRVPMETGSFRDQYVMAAVLEAWAAECYTRIKRDDAEATAQGQAMMDSLQNAENFCNDAEVISNGHGQLPLTWSIYRCGELSVSPNAGAVGNAAVPPQAPSVPAGSVQVPQR